MIQLYLAGAALTALVLIGWRLYDAGYASAEAVWVAKALEAKIVKLEREIAVQQAADAAEDKAALELKAENDTLEKQRAALLLMAREFRRETAEFIR